MDQHNKVSMNKAQAEILRKTKRANELADLREVMSTPAGRRVMWKLLSIAKMFSPCFTGNSRTYYNEGRREMMLPLYDDLLKADDLLFFKMRRENMKQSKED